MWSAWLRSGGWGYVVGEKTREAAIASLMIDHCVRNRQHSTYWVCIVATSDTGERWEGRVPVHPPEPPCPKRHIGHQWKVISERLHGDGVETTRRCSQCGLEKVRNTWATDPETGERGLLSIQYRFPNNEHAGIREVRVCQRLGSRSARSSSRQGLQGHWSTRESRFGST